MSGFPFSTVRPQGSREGDYLERKGFSQHWIVPAQTPERLPAIEPSSPGRGLARPAIIGNPYEVEIYGRQAAIELYPLWIFETLLRGDRQAKRLRRALRLVRGCNLLCYCKPGEDCHADWLLELLNGFHFRHRGRGSKVIWTFQPFLQNRKEPGQDLCSQPHSFH